MKPEIEVIYYFMLGGWPKNPSPEVAYIINQIGQRCQTKKDFIELMVYLITHEEYRPKS